MFRIYILRDDDGTVRYVGQTTQRGDDRPKHHLVTGEKTCASRERSAVHRWVRKRKGEGRTITWDFIAEASSKEAMDRLEVAFIAFYRERNPPTKRLLNITDGGGGTPGWKMLDATKEKLRTSNLGKRATRATKMKMSEARVGKPGSRKGKPNRPLDALSPNELRKRLWRREYLAQKRRERTCFDGP